MTALRAAIDVTPVITGRTGIARYVRELGAALAALGVDVAPFAVGRGRFPTPPGTTHLRVPARLVQMSWDRLGWPPAERLTGDVDLVHEPGLLLPRTRRPLVVTVHDLAALHHPELHPERHVNAQRALVGKLHRADAIIADSAATADDLVHAGCSEERIVVALLGLTPLQPPEVAGPVRGEFVLTVGESSPRKGYDTLLTAMSRLGDDVRLVMAGPAAGDDARLRRRVGELGLGDRVVMLGPVDDAILSALYRDATALCFPSVAEGFGLPVLEAMASGLPVISSEIPVLREVTGGSAVFAAVGDADGWAQAIEGLLGDAEMQAQLTESGARRAREFTWERTARATLTAYELATGIAPPPQ